MRDDCLLHLAHHRYDAECWIHLTKFIQADLARFKRAALTEHDLHTTITERYRTAYERGLLNALITP